MVEWRKVRIVFCDVDGVLTDGGIYFGPDGQVFKRFDVQDGYGIRRLLEEGVRVVFVSGDDSPIVQARARRLGVAEVYTGVGNKAEVVQSVLEREGIGPEEACFVGDDVLDLGAMQAVGVAVAVADGHPEALAVASYVTTRPGGHGAVREVCDHIIAARRER